MCDRIRRTEFVIEDDVWIGHNATILPSVSRVGRGSVIAAGAVVTKDIPRYSVVAGVPARIIKYRFCNERILEIETSKWWEKDKQENLKVFLGR